MTKCTTCGREFFVEPKSEKGNISTASYCYVVHGYYGCDTGCCGHIGYLCAEDGTILDDHFEFAHPFHTDEEFIRDFLGSLWKDVPIKFEECNVYDDM